MFCFSHDAEIYQCTAASIKVCPSLLKPCLVRVKDYSELCPSHETGLPAGKIGLAVSYTYAGVHLSPFW